MKHPKQHKPANTKPDSSGYRPVTKALCAYKRIAGLHWPIGTSGGFPVKKRFGYLPLWD
ncbi:hypothetical protein [Mucilaginibacter sp.]|uniref:hypothetical protein n=1 Tax=Mucilaginibacter sp. TaxID=1882438 RepID=UPI0032651DB3